MTQSSKGTNNKLGQVSSTRSHEAYEASEASTCTCRSFTNTQVLCVCPRSRLPKRESRSTHLLLKAAYKSFFGEQKVSLSDFRHANLPKPAIFCPAFDTANLLHTYFETFVHVRPIFSPDRLVKRLTQSFSIHGGPIFLWEVLCVYKEFVRSSLFEGEETRLLHLQSHNASVCSLPNFGRTISCTSL